MNAMSHLTHAIRPALFLAFLVGGLCLTWPGQLPQASAGEPITFQEEVIPILGITMDKEPMGTIAYLILNFGQRDDESGLQILFKNSPGRFSPMAQTSVEQAIRRAARSMNLSPHSWTVTLAVPYRDLTIYGESLSAMVGLSVIAMARGESIPMDRVMTGTVTPDGSIGPVGSVSLKVTAAKKAHLARVIVPDERDAADRDWQTPFLMQVSPVRSVSQAYVALTEQAVIH